MTISSRFARPRATEVVRARSLETTERARRSDPPLRAARARSPLPLLAHVGSNPARGSKAVRV